MKLKIGTINFWGGSALLIKDKRRRFDKLVALIKKEKFGVLALQEVWSKADAKKLQKVFGDYHFYRESGLMTNRFGLVLMSRFKIQRGASKKFGRKFNWKSFFRKFIFKESFFDKGYQKCKLDKMGVTVVNTHVNYTVDKRKLHLEKLFGSDLRGDRVFVCGDFNCDYKNISLPKGFKFVSDLSKPTLASKNPYSNTLFNKFHFDNWTCDLIITNSKARVLKRKTFVEPVVSDHFLVSTEIDILR